MGQFTSAPVAVHLIVAKEGFKGLYAVCQSHFSEFRFYIPVSYAAFTFLFFPISRSLIETITSFWTRYSVYTIMENTMLFLFFEPFLWRCPCKNNLLLLVYDICFLHLTLSMFLIFQGYGSFLLRDLPFDAIQFCMYEQLRIGYKLVVGGEDNY